jgi:GNAT superfamily N-acetyltransferase
MSASYPKIRLATLADLPQLMEIGHELHRENGMMTIADDLIEEVTRRAISRDGAILGVIGDVGAIEGMIYLVIGRFWYTRDPHIEELFSYVRPEYRRSKNAKALVEFAKKTAEDLEVPLLIGIISNNDTQRKIKLYERILGPAAGAYFLSGARTGS